MDFFRGGSVRAEEEGRVEEVGGVGGQSSVASATLWVVSGIPLNLERKSKSSTLH